MSDPAETTAVVVPKEAAPTPGPSFRVTMIVTPMFKLITRADGAIVVESDPSGDGKGPTRIEVPSEHALEFLHFLSVAARDALDIRRGPY